MLTTTSSTLPNLCIRKYQRLLHVSNPRFLFHNSHFLRNQSTSSLELHLANNNKISRYVAVYAGVDPGPVVPPDPSSVPWKIWIVGVLITVILPFWKNKFWPIIKLKDKLESIVETAEEVSEAIEKVAEGVEKVAEEIADHVPEGGRLKKAAVFVEDVARQTAKDAHLVEEFIDKVEEVEKEAGTLIGSAMDEANDMIKETKDQHN